MEGSRNGREVASSSSPPLPSSPAFDDAFLMTF